MKNTNVTSLRFVPAQHSFLTVTGTDGLAENFRAQVAAPGRPIRPGGSARVWIRFALPDELLPQLGQPGSGLCFLTVEDLSHFGAIALWNWADARGERALGGLSGG